MKLSVFFDHILQSAKQTGKSIPELLDEVRTAGIDAVEINMTYLCERKEVYRQLQDAGLRVSCVYEFYEMEQKDEMDRAKLHIETAQKAGAGKILVVPGFVSKEEAAKMRTCFPNPDRTKAYFEKNDKILRMAEGLFAIAEQGAGEEIAVTVEDFDDACSPLSGMNGLRWFLDRIPQLGYTFDTGNFIVQKENELTAWELLKDRIVHVHCKDRGSKPLAVGAGTILIPAIIERLQQIHYQGYLAIEHFDAEDQESCIRNSARFLKNITKNAMSSVLDHSQVS